MFLNLSWGYSGRYPAEEGGEGGKRDEGGMTTATEEEEGKEGRGKRGGIALARGLSCRIKAHGRKM